MITKTKSSAFSLIENLVAITIVVLFFSALYALNSQSLSVLNSGRGTAIAQKCLEDRIEQLRSCTWSQLTDATYLQNNVFNTSSIDVANLGNVTETVTVNAYPVALSPAICLVRSNGSTTIASSNANIAASDLVRVDAALAWQAGTGGRTRTRATVTLIAKNIP